MILRSLALLMFTAALLITSVEASPRPPETDSPKTIVLKLYRDFAWEAVMDVPAWPGLIDQPKNVLERYFDDKLTSLILKDRACAKKQGLCRLDFLPIWASQDPSAGDLTVEESGEPHIVLVKFRYRSTNEEVQLKYRMSKTTRGWRISDITGSDWSLLSILGSPE